MSAAYIPGSDSTTNGIGSSGQSPDGVFARYIKGSTPKYAKNSGLREEQYKNTMARMFMRVDQSEFVNLFLPSIADRHLVNAVTQLAGDPSRQARGPGANETGYMDFLLQQVQHSFREKVQVVETLSDNYVVYYFGQSAPLWTYQGSFINTQQDDQASNFVRLYLSVLRGTQLARRNKSISIRYDSFTVAGTIETLDWSIAAQNELLCPFTLSLRVKRLYIMNCTLNWQPTKPTANLIDPNSVAYSNGGPSSQRIAYQLYATVPPDTEQAVAPTPTSASPPSTNPQQSSVDNEQNNFSSNANPNVRDTRPVTSSNPVPSPPLSTENTSHS